MDNFNLDYSSEREAHEALLHERVLTSKDYNEQVRICLEAIEHDYEFGYLYMQMYSMMHHDSPSPWRFTQETIDLLHVEDKYYYLDLGISRGVLMCKFHKAMGKLLGDSREPSNPEEAYKLFVELKEDGVIYNELFVDRTIDDYIELALEYDPIDS